jgi:small subunit ribosomal protein S1
LTDQETQGVASPEEPLGSTAGDTNESPAAAEAATNTDAETAVAVAERDEATTAPDDGAAAAGSDGQAPADAISSQASEPTESPTESAATEPAAATESADTTTEPAATESAADTTESSAASESTEAEATATEAATATESAEAPPAEGPEPTTMDELLGGPDAEIRSFKHGDVVEGAVVRIDKDEILVDIGAKSEGVVSNRELAGRHAEAPPALKLGDTVLVYVMQPESDEGHAILSLRRAGLERKWRAMQEQFEAGAIIEAPVIDHNKGGLIVDCGIRGFIPISQIVDFPRRPQNDQPRDAAQEIAEKLQPFVGRRLRLKILEVNRKANRLILSEKVALYEERREKRDELFSSLQVGQKVKGVVRSIAPFGVFVDLGGIDGLVHKSELSWNKVNNPEAGYKVGDEVDAEVIDINHERGRISLSIRRLQPDPWHSTVADYKVGDIIDGTVTKLVNFGAFVRVRDGLEGLIHISELSHARVTHPSDVVREGQALKLKIISLDSERHRLGLSLKQAEEAPVRAEQPRQRRERPQREYSPADAVQESEGGIDNTLAAAFAQVREQMAATEQARAAAGVGGDEGEEASVAAEPTALAEAPAAEATAEAAPAMAATAPDASMSESEAPTAEAEPTTTAQAEPTTTAEAEPVATAEAESATTGETESTASADGAAADESEPGAETASAAKPKQKSGRAAKASESEETASTDATAG